MNPSPTVTKIKYVGLDVHAETIAVAIADSAGVVRPYGIVPAHTHSVDRLVKKLAEDGAEVRYVYDRTHRRWADDVRIETAAHSRRSVQ